MSRHNLGDVVTVKKNLVGDKWYGDLLFTPSMKKYRGKSFEIIKVGENDYNLKGTSDWLFNDEMFYKKPVSQEMAVVNILVDKELSMPVFLANKLEKVLSDKRVKGAKTFTIVRTNKGGK